MHSRPATVTCVMPVCHFASPLGAGGSPSVFTEFRAPTHRLPRQFKNCGKDILSQMEHKI